MTKLTSFPLQALLDGLSSLGMTSFQSVFEVVKLQQYVTSQLTRLLAWERLVRNMFSVPSSHQLINEVGRDVLVPALCAATHGEYSFNLVD